MNLTDLHYVVEIDKSGSISKAARNFMWRSQILVKRSSIWSGNLEFLSLSGRQRELRRPEKDRKFLEYAKRIIYEIEEMKRDCSDLGKEKSLI